MISANLAPVEGQLSPDIKKKLEKEYYINFTSKIQESVQLLPQDKQTLRYWKIVLLGPADTPYEKGLLTVIIELPQNYPKSAPKCKFSPIPIHPNLFPDGTPCTELLSSWKGEYIPLKTIGETLQNLLAKPNWSSQANSIANQIRSTEGEAIYAKKAKESLIPKTSTT